jgi:16S rRNA (guanine(966)-N(2))-methyltransferase RsmD
LRIISGTAKGCKLAEFSYLGIRPTSDRVREAVFSILISRMGHLSGCTVLDIFAGTGAMGLEALSRGANSALFVDHAKESIDLVKKNAKTARLMDKSRFSQADAEQSIMNQTQPYDLIFIDPPYALQEINQILELLVKKNLLKTDGIICVETAHDTKLSEIILDLEQIDRRKYGSTSISLYQHGDHS